MQYTMKNFSLLSALLCLFTFSFPLQSNAEEKELEQNTLQMPSLGGKLNLTPQKQEENSAQQDEQKENLQNKFQGRNSIIAYKIKKQKSQKRIKKRNK